MIAIGAAGSMQAPKSTEQKSIDYDAGQEAKRNKIPLHKSAVKNLRPDSKQYFDFIDGYDSK